MKKVLPLLILISNVFFAQIKFDADFESGNINNVTTTDSVHYVVTTREDIGGRWFYFRMSGVKDKFINVYVKNSDCKRAVYSYDDITYSRFSASETPGTNKFEKTFDEDTVFVAYYTPYNYCYLQQRLADWSESEFVKIDTLGLSDRGFPMQEISLTDFSVPNDEKEFVWIHSRTHPGETPASWHFDGIVQTLLKDDPVIKNLLKKVVFYMVPFNNPDGVYYGHSRTNTAFIDHERQWDVPEEQAPKATNVLRARLKEICEIKPVAIMLNMHSQASASCTFWIHHAQATSDYFFRKEMQFSNLNVSDNSFFVKNDFCFSNGGSRYPEGWCWDNHGDKIMALTYETPYDKYSTGIWVTNENLFELGERTLYAMMEYMGISHSRYMLLDNTDAIAFGQYSEEANGFEFFGDNYTVMEAGDNGNELVYQSEELEAGSYAVTGWWPSASDYSYNTRFKIATANNNIIVDKSQRKDGGAWNKLSDVTLNNPGTIKITVANNENGKAVADAFRIVYLGPVSEVEDELAPKDFVLAQNYPNPFNPSTTIRFSLHESGNVSLKVYNPLGELVDVLLDDYLSQGNHEIKFDSRTYGNLASGIYYYQLNTDYSSETKGMILLK